MWNKSGKTVWPDFSHPSATLYWTNQYKNFHKMVPIDGSWNDMNEIANSAVLDGCPKNSSLENPPYKVGNMTLSEGHDLYDSQTLFWPRIQCPQLIRLLYGNRYQSVIIIILVLIIVNNINNYFSALREVRQKRPFIISRASSPGQGKYSGHWDGDTDTTYEEMAWTIPCTV